MASKFICEWCSGGFRTESGLAWHVGRSHSVQVSPAETTTVEPVDEGKLIATSDQEEPIATGQEEQLPQELPEPTPEEQRAELEEIINDVVGPMVSALRLELHGVITSAINKAEAKALDEKRTETVRQKAKESEVEELVNVLTKAFERNDNITATLAGIGFVLHTQPGDDPSLIEQVVQRMNTRKRTAMRASLSSYFLDSSYGQHTHNHRRLLFR